MMKISCVQDSRRNTVTSLIGRLVVLSDEEDATVYVVERRTPAHKTYVLVAVDRPVEDHVTITLGANPFWILEPLDILERVRTWQ